MALAAVPLLAALALLVGLRKRKVISSMGDPSLLARLREGYSPDRRVLRTGIALAALSFAVIATARPQAGWQLTQGAAKGIDIVIAMDVSASMLAEDVKPSRLERAKAELGALLDDLRGDRVAVIAFAGSASPACPLTADGRAAAMFLDALSWGVVSEPGTDVGEAVDRAIRSFDSAPDRSRAVVLVTDGEDHEGSIEVAAQRAAEAGVSVFCVGVGGEAGEPIPMSLLGGAQGFRRDSKGQVVLSRLNAGGLRDLASAAGGSFFVLGPSGGDLRSLWRELQELPRKERPEEYSGRSERFHVAALIALCLLVVNWFVGESRGRVSGRVFLGLTLVSFLCAPAAPALAAEAEKGAALYEKGDYLGALAKFREGLAGGPSAPLYHDCGNALYRLEKFGEAAEQYGGSLADADPSLLASARYNRGNSLFRLGDIGGAAEQYIEALKLNPEDMDAKHNLELALRQMQQNQQSSSPDSSSSEGGQEDSQQEQGEKQEGGMQEGENEQDGESPPAGQESETEGGDQGQQEHRGSFSKEEAERLLEALGAEEKDQLKKRMKAKVRRKGVEKDW
jgi:Ca-activated chloride channel family protein